MAYTLVRLNLQGKQWGVKMAIQPDYELFLKILFLIMGINAIIKILCGAIGADKPDKYGLGDVGDGLLALAILIYVSLV